MRFKTHLRKKKIVSMDLTPLVDTVFNLLLFFMLTSKFVLQPGIQIELPRADPDQQSNENQITVIIERSGEIYLEDLSDPIALAELSNVLENRMKGMKDPFMGIAADRGVSIETVMRVLVTARKIGIQHAFIYTEPEE